VVGSVPIISARMSSTDTATSVIVKHRKNWRRTLLPFPRIIEGITEDKTKIHAKACMKTIVLIRRISSSAVWGKKLFRNWMTEYTAV